MSPLRPSVRGALLIILAGVLWSTGGMGIKLLNGYGPMTVAGGRSVVCGLMFLVLLGGRIIPPSGSRWWILAGAVNYALLVLA